MKRLLTKICHAFELSDYEYIRGMFGPWPFRFFITVMRHYEQPDVIDCWMLSMPAVRIISAQVTGAHIILTKHQWDELHNRKL